MTGSDSVTGDDKLHVHESSDSNAAIFMTLTSLSGRDTIAVSDEDNGVVQVSVFASGAMDPGIIRIDAVETLVIDGNGDNDDISVGDFSDTYITNSTVSCTGGSGNDTFTGGAGDDFMAGGSGEDIFAFDTPRSRLYGVVFWFFRRGWVNLGKCCALLHDLEITDTCEFGLHDQIIDGLGADELSCPSHRKRGTSAWIGQMAGIASVITQRDGFRN